VSTSLSVIVFENEIGANAYVAFALVMTTSSRCYAVADSFSSISPMYVPACSLVCVAHSFSAPAVMPRMNARIVARNKMNMGRDAIT
jgi:hypothetical protein